MRRHLPAAEKRQRDMRQALRHGWFGVFGWAALVASLVLLAVLALAPSRAAAADAVSTTFSPTTVILPSVGSTTTITVSAAGLPAGADSIQVNIQHTGAGSVTSPACVGVFSGATVLGPTPVTGGTAIACFFIGPKVSGTTGNVMTFVLSRLTSESSPITLTMLVGGGLGTQFSAGGAAIGPGTTNAITVNPAPTLTVTKVLVPAADAGMFNLQVDGATAGTGASVGNGGTTGAVPFTVGSHTVGETAVVGTNLGDYVTTIGGDCAATGAITLASGDNKVCTITNSRLRVAQSISHTTEDVVEGGVTRKKVWTTIRADGGTQGGVAATLPGGIRHVAGVVTYNPGCMTVIAAKASPPFVTASAAIDSTAGRVNLTVDIPAGTPAATTFPVDFGRLLLRLTGPATAACALTLEATTIYQPDVVAGSPVWPGSAPATITYRRGDVLGSGNPKSVAQAIAILQYLVALRTTDQINPANAASIRPSHTSAGPSGCAPPTGTPSTGPDNGDHISTAQAILVLRYIVGIVDDCYNTPP